MVFVVAKTADDALAMLVKELDAMVVSQKDKNFNAVVNIVGDPKGETKDKVKKYGEQLNLKKVPLVATTDVKPFKVSDDAEVTVLTYRGKKVRFNYALAKGGLDKAAVATIIADAKKMLAEPAEEPKDKAKGKKKSDAKSKGKPKEKPKEKAEP